jgi:hypothetical protein
VPAIGDRRAETGCRLGSYGSRDDREHPRHGVAFGKTNLLRPGRTALLGSDRLGLLICRHDLIASQREIGATKSTASACPR